MTTTRPKKLSVLGLGIYRPIGMAMVVLAVTVFGIVSLDKLPVDLLPPIDYPTLIVRAEYPGAAPEDVEERVADRLEDSLATVGGLVRMRSTSRAESCEVFLEFEWGSNLPFLVQDVRERLDRVFLPQGVERPIILRYDPSLDPILRVALSGGNDLVRLRDAAEREVERELEGIPGVAAVKVRGGLEDEVQVRVKPDRLAWFKISSMQVLSRLREENLNVPGGTLEEGEVEYVVRTLNEFRTLEEIIELPIVVRGDRFVKLGDLATVVRSHKDRDVILRVDGEEAVEIDIYREAGANIVETAKAVKDRLFGSAEQREYWRKQASVEEEGDWDEEEALKRERMSDYIARKLPSDQKLTLLSDQAEFVQAAIREVRNAGLIGGLLAIVVCFLFLRRLPPTLVIGLSIPISIVATFGPMYLGGVSLNVMSLGGLALGIGMLVDNTIVVLESIARCREDGDPPLEASLRGVREVGGAVTASTLTTVAVFAPIVFVEGIAGQTFGDQAMTVVASLTLSLAVALFFIPGVTARVDRKVTLPPAQAGKVNKAPATKLFRGCRHPRSVKGWVLVAVCLLIGLGLTSGARMQMETLVGDANLPGEQPGFADLPKEQQIQPTALMYAGSAFLLGALWWVLEYVLVVTGRLLHRLFGLSGSLLWPLLGGLSWLVRKLLAPAVTLVQWILGAMQRVYPSVLRSALASPWIVFAIAGALGYVTYLSTQQLGRELLPEVLQREFTAEVILPAGSPLEDTDAFAVRMEREFRRIDGVVEAAVVSGADRESVSTQEEGPHTTRILVRTEDAENPRQLEGRVERQVRAILSREPAIARFNIRRPTLLALHAPLEIEVIGEDLEEIERLAKRVEETIRNTIGIVDLRTSVRRGNPEVLVTLNRERLAEHNLMLADVANRLRIAVEGEISSTFPGKDDRIDIRVRADLSQLEHVDQLRNVYVNPAAERPLPLGAVAEFEIADGPSEIRHINSRRAAVLSATTSGFDLGKVTDRVERKLATIPRPVSMELRVGGQKREMEQSLGSLYFALGLAVFLVYAVMAAQFESLVQPLLIMFSVPLAGIGAVFSMALTNTPVSVVALLGAVVLAGIVVNNAIVLVDRINRNRSQGHSLEQAIVEAGSARLRPILMTTVTTVLGMLPLTGWFSFLGGAEGTELRAPMALVVIGGLTCSTLLTLIVIPTGYRVLALLTATKA